MKPEWILDHKDEILVDRYKQPVKIGDTVAVPWYGDVYIGKIVRQSQYMIFIDVAPSKNHKGLWSRKLNKDYIFNKLIVVNKRINFDEL